MKALGSAKIDVNGKRSGLVRNENLALIIVLSIIIGGILAVLIMSPSDSNAPEIPAEPTRTPVPPGAILSSIKTSGELITVKHERAVVDLEVRDPASLGCTYTAQHVAKSVIEAGIDLSAIDEDNIQRNAFGYPQNVIAPVPAISSCRIEYFRQYDRKGGGTAKCFGNNWDAMSDIGRHLAMDWFVEEALKSGIIEQAEQQTSLVLKAQIQDLIGGRVEIEFEDAPEEPIIPDSCRVKPPANWAPHDADNQRDWKRTN